MRWVDIRESSSDAVPLYVRGETLACSLYAERHMDYWFYRPFAWYGSTDEAGSTTDSQNPDDKCPDEGWG